MYEDPKLISTVHNLSQENKAIGSIKARKWGRKECFVVMEVTNGVKEMRCSNERERNVYHGRSVLSEGKCVTLWGKEDDLKEEGYLSYLCLKRRGYT